MKQADGETALHNWRFHLSWKLMVIAFGEVSGQNVQGVRIET